MNSNPPPNGYRNPPNRPQNPQNQQNPQGRPSPNGVPNPQYRPNPNPNPNGQGRPMPGGMNPQTPNGQYRPVPNQPPRPQNPRPPQKPPKKPKVKLTPVQMEQERIRRRREKYRIRRQRAASARLFAKRFLLFVVLFVLIGALSAGMLYLTLIQRDSEDVSGYSFYYGEDRAYTLSYTDAVRDGRVFLNFTDLAEFCELSTVGSLDDIKYVIKSAEDETLRFVVGTHTVYVNGIETRLSAESFLKEDELFVPLDFVEAYLKGLTVELNERTNRVTITREEVVTLDAQGKPVETDEPVFKPLSFILAAPTPMPNIDESTISDIVPMPTVSFLANLAGYEEYMNPGNTTEYITLVNANNMLDASYVPQDLVASTATRNDREDQQLRLYAAKALEAMMLEFEAAGFNTEEDAIKVSVTSGYRSYGLQNYLFNQKVQEYSYLGDGARAQAATVVNPPGSSEHQTGLCFDLHNLASADIAFGQTDEFKWLRDNCWKFGFILRYPEDKIAETGISYEPWHYRYVGRYHAQRMFESGMCLEEYTKYLGLN